MKRIPKSLQLLGHTITVRVLSKRDWEVLTEMNEHIDEEDFGAWFQSQNLILIRRTTKSLMLHTLYHELFHAVLDMMNSPLSNDEALVDNLAGLFSQAMGTAK
jgi:Zn-dependent peptidase ImmA (M78 family)